MNSELMSSARYHSEQVMAAVALKRVKASDPAVLIGGLGIILLGTMTGVIVSLVAMQYFKSPEHQPIVKME